MHNEQVFTPKQVTDIMLNELGYYGDTIRKKHIIDNSCGNGSILTEIVKDYINICIMWYNLSKEETVKELETYIHGIEIDEKLYQETIDNLNKVAANYSIFNVKWDIVNGDAMDIHTYDNMMDYVIGNPPYCNIHDISEEKREKVKSYKFANGGMTDMYLVFFEIGINMLNENGKLAYITPNSWFTSVAGTNFRNYLKETKTLYALYQYGHYKVFDNVSTYTCITCLLKTQKNDSFKCYKNMSESKCHFECLFETLENCMVNGKIYLTDKETLNIIREINNIDKKDKHRIRVKNGFATLNDKLFIIDDFVEKYGSEEDNILSVTKASNGEKHYFFYPYDEYGKPIKSLLSLNCPKLVDYIIEKARKLEVDTENVAWYYYGRTQAINDVKYDKLIVNNVIRNKDDLKIEILFNNDKTQMGVYSGYYIPLYDYDIVKMNKIVDLIKNQKFVDYVKAVGKYKSGGYYTFSSKELEMWLNYCFKRKL